MGTRRLASLPAPTLIDFAILRPNMHPSIPLALSLLSTASCVLADGEVQKTKVLILGAGLTGVTAAKALALERNITDYLIVEALPEVGGRLKSTTIGGYPVEIGANWIQGTNLLQSNLQEAILIASQDSELIQSGTWHKDITSQTFSATGQVSIISMETDTMPMANFKTHSPDTKI